MAKRFTFKSRTLAAPLSVEETAEKYGVSAKELNEVRHFVDAYVGKRATKARFGSSPGLRVATHSRSKSKSSRTRGK